MHSGGLNSAAGGRHLSAGVSIPVVAARIGPVVESVIPSPERPSGVRGFGYVAPLQLLRPRVPRFTLATCRWPMAGPAAVVDAPL